VGIELSRDDIFATIGEALGSASEIALQYFRTAVPVDIKSDSSPVTLADHEIEQASCYTGAFPNAASSVRSRGIARVAAVPGSSIRSMVPRASCWVTRCSVACWDLLRMTGWWRVD
jgi:hypothetical protein